MPDPHLQYTPAVAHSSPEERARFWEAEYWSLLDSLPDAVYTQDLEGNIVSSNTAGERLSGFQRSELVRMNIRQLVTAESHASATTLVQDAIAGRQQMPAQAELVTRNGSVVPIELHIVIRRDL